MPKARKIKVIDLGTETVENVVEAVVEEVEAVVEEVEEVQTPSEPVVMKAKSKPRVKAQPKPVIEEEPVIEEQPKIAELSKIVEPPPVEVVEKIKPKLELFPCPRCGKELTQKGLKYSHKCPADKVLKQPEPVVEKIIEKRPRVVKQKPAYDNIPEELIQNEIKKIMAGAKEMRANRHQDNIKRLAVNIV